MCHAHSGETAFFCCLFNYFFHSYLPYIEDFYIEDANHLDKCQKSRAAASGTDVVTIAVIPGYIGFNSSKEYIR
jgi:hypothetical protein